MDWQDTLIRLYLLVCHSFQHQQHTTAQRLSNNHHPEFTDPEVVTIYLFGILRQHRTLRALYQYTADHLAEWFPRLPCYGGYVQRLNRLHEVFPGLVEQALAQCTRRGLREAVLLVDSMPIVLAASKRSGQARVAAEIANKGRCASKNMYFYGVKVHLVAVQRPGGLPLPAYIGLSPGAAHDLSVLRHLVPHLRQCHLYGDKIYADAALQEQLARDQQVQLWTPVKRAKRQKALLLTESAWSTLVSKVRQPIESLINWIEEQTGLEGASKVRSYAGLMVHVFGRLAAAMFLLSLYP